MERRADIKELERTIMHDASEQKRIKVTSGMERLRAHEQRCSAINETRIKLQTELDTTSRGLEESIVENRALDDRMKELLQEHTYTLSENLCAQRALSKDSSLKDYKKTKEAERFLADDAVASAQEECEACIDELDGRWEEQQMKHHNDLLELQGKVLSLQKWHDDQAADAERLLMQQSLDKSAIVDALNERVETKMRDLDAIRHQRVLTLQAEVEQARGRVADVSLCVKRCLSVHRKEMRDAYHEKLQDEESRCLKTIRNGHRSVQAAKKESERLEKDAARLREQYVAHAVNSKTYVRSLDAKRRKQLVHLWCRSS